jgi:6-pyruvoyltetrahydropterin/6-carboxytetrahydropterin synthase
MILVTRKAHFNAAHKLWNPEWDEARNREVFGKCAHHNWHGHNFELWVTVQGEVHPETGFVVDLKYLKQVIEDRVIEPLDHSNINLDVPFMAGRMASTENLAMAIWDQLWEPLLGPSHRLYCVQLFETHRNSVTYYGPSAPASVPLPLPVTPC